MLELFRDGPDDFSLTAIAKATGLNVSTAYRLVRALVDGALMEQDPRTDRYRLGAGMAVLGQRAMRSVGLDHAKPMLDDLADTTGESVSLASRTGSSVRVVLTASATRGLRFDHPLGGAIEIHASAMGKILLAFADRGPTMTSLSDLGELIQFTRATVTSPRALLRELATVRAEGVARNREERYPGVSGVAVPVLDRHGHARYALGVQGPALRLTDVRVSELAVLARQTAEVLAATLASET